MNRKQLIEYFEVTTDKMIEIMKSKNADYSGSRDEEYAFANFDVVKYLGLCEPPVGFLTRITDKLTRVCGFVKSGKLMVKDESVEDTLIDMANYCLLLSAWIKSHKVGS